MKLETLTMFDEINVFDDSIDEMDIIRNTINIQKPEEAFYIADIGGVIKKHFDWINKMPRVIPHYAIKCNSDPTVIKILAAMNASFDCASMQEIKQVMHYGVKGECIIFAHPTKLPSHIKYSKKVGVERMTVDSETELSKIQEFFPEAKIVIRIRCDAKNSLVSFGEKFGCEPHKEAVRLIRRTKDLGMNLHGFSFHVGTLCKELDAYHRGIKMCVRLINIARVIGCSDVQLIDIGGGFSAECEVEIDRVAKIINKAIENLDPAIRVISEPGRYYVGANFTLASYLHSKRTVCENDEKKMMYYMNCGVYNSFFDELLGLQSRTPRLIFEPMKNEKFSSILWGPTADSYDLIAKDVQLPELYVGDWLVWKNMGAYTLSISNTFNGFPIPAVIPFVRKSQWENFLQYIDSK
ncbi:PREDICTED: ornithine decarboxylase 2-like [Dinoponera quadriceps]|uniref:Ornithine decarboxylase 2-like n=1 Tax=Dinoponera quadriceps TaxID=609295 RepID=A0A6P3Y063_DINQU|nr:PREDICTED: ornithine decarboxylase 2-like [Dinoponera quadriceps]